MSLIDIFNSFKSIFAYNFDMNNIYEQLFYESLDAQVLLDLELNKFLMCNEKVFELYGYTKEEFLNLTPYDLSLEFKDNIQMENKQENIYERGFDKFITKHKRKDGQSIDVYVKSKKVNFNDKYWLFINLCDITNENILKEYFNDKTYVDDILIIQNEYKWYKNISILMKGNLLIELSFKERKILSYLLSNINSVVSNKTLIELFENQKVTNNSILSLIKRIRKKTSNDFINTVYSEGYVIYKKF